MQFGLAWQAGQGTERHGRVWNGGVWQAWRVVEGFGSLRQGMAGEAGTGLVRLGAVGFGLIF